MGLRVIIGNEETRDGLEVAVMYCSTNGIAFGPTMNGNAPEDAKTEGGPIFDAEQEAQLFINWLKQDARNYSANELDDLYGAFVDWYKHLPADTDIQSLIDDESMMAEAR